MTQAPGAAMTVGTHAGIAPPTQAEQAQLPPAFVVAPGFPTHFRVVMPPRQAVPPAAASAPPREPDGNATDQSEYDSGPDDGDAQAGAPSDQPASSLPGSPPFTTR